MTVRSSVDFGGTNSELSLDGEGRSDAVDPRWREPLEPAPGTYHRIRKAVIAVQPAPGVTPSAEPQDGSFDFDPMDCAGYVTMVSLAFCCRNSDTCKPYLKVIVSAQPPQGLP